METVIESPPETAACARVVLADDQARTEKFVSFQLGAHLYAVHAAAVAEVTHPLPVTNLPDQPSGLLGIAPLRGEIIAVVDIRRMLSEPAVKEEGQKLKQIVLKTPVDGSLAIGFVVDRLGEIAAIDISGIQRTDNNEFIFGSAEIDGRSFRILDHSRISEALAYDR